MEQSIEIFFCYAREDEPLRQELEKQLRALRRQGIINLWHDRDISAGEEWQRAIDKHLNSANIILLLVSPDFIDSDYCYGIEMKRAMERHEREDARVIPIILRPVYWQKAPFGRLQALPTDAVPVTSPVWHTQDEAFFNVAEGIRLAVEEILAKGQVKQWYEKGLQLQEQKHYEDALVAFNQMLRFDPNNVEAYVNNGNVLIALKRYEDALAAFNQALRLDPNNAHLYINKGDTLIALKRYEDALVAYNISINPCF